MNWSRDQVACVINSLLTKAACFKLSNNLNILGLNIDLTANLEFWGWDSLGIGRNLVSVLGFGNVQLKLLVQLIKVGDENLSTCQCKVAFRVNGDVWVITLVGKEGCNASGGIGVLLYVNLANGKSSDQLSYW